VQALDRIYAHLAPGAWVYTNAPIINIPHMVPFHYSGITPMGACMLFLSAGFDIVEVGYWGNLEYIYKIFHSGEWPDWRQSVHDGVLRNEERCAAGFGLLARKPPG
jgi:hypothetical protein